MRKFIVLLLIVSLVFGITACGSDSGDDDVVEETNQDIEVEDDNVDEEITEELDTNEDIVEEDELDFKEECEANAKEYPAGPGKILYTKGDNLFTGMGYYFKGEIVKFDIIDNSVGDPSVWLVKNDAGYVMPIQHEYFIADIGDVVEVWGTLSGNGYEKVDGVDNVVGITGSMHAMQVTINGEEQY